MTPTRFALPRTCSRIVILLWLAPYLLVAEGPSKQPMPDLTGTWKLNAKSSKQGAIHGSEMLEIKHSGTVLKIRHRNPSGDNTYSYVIDGKEGVAKFATDGVTTAKTYWEGDTLIIESHHHDNNRSFVQDIFLTTVTHCRRIKRPYLLSYTACDPLLVAFEQN